MPHWRQLIDRSDQNLLYAHDLEVNGEYKDFHLTIKRVEGGVLTGDRGKKTKKPIIQFEETDKRLGAGATICKTIEALVGTPDYNKWTGQRVTLYKSRTTAQGGEEVDCIRVRPIAPPPKARAKNGVRKEESTGDPLGPDGVPASDTNGDL
jgi:hypothetical protein